MNTVKDLIKSGKTVVGTGGSVVEADIAMLADSGLDFILFDTQHKTLLKSSFECSVNVS